MVSSKDAVLMVEEGSALVQQKLPAVALQDVDGAGHPSTSGPAGSGSLPIIQPGALQHRTSRLGHKGRQGPKGDSRWELQRLWPALWYLLG